MTNTVGPITDEERRRFLATPWLEIAAQDQSALWKRCKAYEARLSAAEEENKRLRSAMTALVRDFDRLIDNSDGVSGGRLSSDIVFWPEVEEFGYECVNSLRTARNALTKGKDDG